MAKGSLILLAGLAALSSACSTTQVNPATASDVPESRNLTKARTASQDATMVVVRDEGFTGAACNVGLFVDKAHVASLAPGERVTVPVASGERLIAVGKDPRAGGLCALGDVQLRQVETILKAGETKRYRITMSVNSGVDIMRSDF